MRQLFDALGGAVQAGDDARGPVAGTGVFRPRAVRLAERVTAAPPAVGHPAVRLPGDVERERAARSHHHGVRLAAATVGELRVVARRLGMADPPPLPDLSDSRRE